MTRSFRRLTKSFLSLAALTGVLLAGTVLVTTSSASAHTILSPHPTCAGSLLDHHDFFSGQISVFVYFSSANGGTNCAWAQKNQRRGQPEFLDVWIARCSTGNPANPCSVTAIDHDPPPSGSPGWEFYAGPVRVTSTNNRCIIVSADYRGSIGPWTAPHHCS